MNWAKLIKMLPLIATAANPALGGLAAALLAIGEGELARRRAKDPSKSVDEILAQAALDWELAEEEAAALLKLGHSDLPPKVEEQE